MLESFKPDHIDSSDTKYGSFFSDISNFRQDSAEINIFGRKKRLLRENSSSPLKWQCKFSRKEVHETSYGQSQEEDGSRNPSLEVQWIRGAINEMQFAYYLACILTSNSKPMYCKNMSN